MNEDEKKLRKLGKGTFFFLVCRARLAEGEATSFPSTSFRERWENGEKTEISVTVTKGVACEGGYASTCVVDFLYKFSKICFIKETAHVQIIYPFKFMTKAKLSFVSLVNIQRFYGCKLRGTFFF